VLRPGRSAGRCWQWKRSMTKLTSGQRNLVAVVLFTGTVAARRGELQPSDGMSSVVRHQAVSQLRDIK
jgi:hypothetical protein